MNWIKCIRIFLLVLIIIGLGLLVTQKIWVPKLVTIILSSETSSNITKVTNVKLGTFDWCVKNGGKNQTPQYNAPKICVLKNKIYKEACVSNDKYFVIEEDLVDSVGSNHLVKYKTSKNENFDCEYILEKGDFEIKNEWAEYTLALENNFLILDSGTGPDPRSLIIYDLNLHKKVYTDEYFKQSVTIKNNFVDYWSPTNHKVTLENCPKLNEYQSGGFEAGIDSHFILDLSNLSKRDLGEYRCTPRQ